MLFDDIFGGPLEASFGGRFMKLIKVVANLGCWRYRAVIRMDREAGFDELYVPPAFRVSTSIVTLS